MEFVIKNNNETEFISGTVDRPLSLSFRSHFVLFSLVESMSDIKLDKYVSICA